MENNKPVAPADVEKLREELKKVEATGTIFVTIWKLASYALAALDWADSLATRIAELNGNVTDLTQQLTSTKEAYQGLRLKAEQWQAQTEWHYEDFPDTGEEVIVVLKFLDMVNAYEARRGVFFPAKPGWWVDGYGWMEDFPAMLIKCWQRINLPLELQAQDKE